MKDKFAIVTGASTGIGRAVAKRKVISFEKLKEDWKRWGMM